MITFIVCCKKKQLRTREKYIKKEGKLNSLHSTTNKYFSKIVF